MRSDLKAIKLAPSADDVVIEGETSALSGGTESRNKHEGYSGDGYADFAGKGSAATFSITRKGVGDVNLQFRYANGSQATRRVRILINDALVGTLKFAPTGSWTNWQTISLDAVELPAGDIEIKLVASTRFGGPNLDNLTISDDPATVQAESQELTGGTTARDKYEGYKGTGYADYGPEDSAVTFNMTRGSAGKTSLSFRYANGSTVDRPLQIFVNNAFVGELAFAPTGGWSIWETIVLENVYLSAGDVTIEVISMQGGGPNVDRLVLSQ